jgi:MtrB/PioB family decaheme-associated outer membrane protein
MKTTQSVFAKTLLGLAVSGVFAPAFADEEADRAALIRPDSSASAGVAVQDATGKNASIFGQYNGLRNDSSHLLLDFNYVKRNDATGMWTIFRGRDIGLDTRELGATFQKQGDWRISADYGEIVHREIRSINTGMLGIGSTNPQVVRLTAPGTGSDADLSLKRKALGLSGEKWILPNLQFELSFKNEDKTGARFWGRGYDCASYVCTSTQNATNTKWATLFIPEPVNFNAKQVEAKLNYSTDALFLSGGYYGSFFTNSNAAVTPTVPGQLNNNIGGLATLNPAAVGGTSLQNVLQLPMALYPDNQAHQFFVSGNYRWSPKINSTFKLAYTHATQNEDFGAGGFTGAPTVTRSNLGGVLDTRLAQFGLTARPMPKLTLNANVRYEDKQDKTPQELYNVENTARWLNSLVSNRKLAGKLEGSYMLPANLRATVGVDYEKIDRKLPGLGVTVQGLSGLRGQTEETTYRAELRRSISETLTGAVGFSHAERKGGNWYSLANIPAQGVVVGGEYSYGQIFSRTNTFPFTLADRKRDKVKASADWSPMEKLSLQFVAEYGRDSYRPPSENGLQKGAMTLYSVDGSYALSEKWKFTAYGSMGSQTMGEADRTNYVADTKNKTAALGFGVVGNPTGVLEVGANVSHVRDVTQYRLTPDIGTTGTNITQNTVGLPDVMFQENRFNVYGKFALNKQSDLRFDLLHVTSKLEEWSWGYAGVPFTYSDNTTLTINPSQRVTLISGRFIYKF